MKLVSIGKDFLLSFNISEGQDKDCWHKLLREIADIIVYHFQINVRCLTNTRESRNSPFTSSETKEVQVGKDSKDHSTQLHRSLWSSWNIPAKCCPTYSWASLRHLPHWKQLLLSLDNSISECFPLLCSLKFSFIGLSSATGIKENTSNIFFMWQHWITIANLEWIPNFVFLCNMKIWQSKPFWTKCKYKFNVLFIHQITEITY